MAGTKTAIRDAIWHGVFAAANSSATDMSTSDTTVAYEKVANNVLPVVEHLTNNEPWYQSRVTWGAIGSIALPLLGLVGVTSDVIDADEFIALGLTLGAAASGLFTLYGRWKARKPIGS